MNKQQGQHNTPVQTQQKCLSAHTVESHHNRAMKIRSIKIAFTIIWDNGPVPLVGGGGGGGGKKGKKKACQLSEAPHQFF